MSAKGLAGSTARAWRKNDPGNEAHTKPRPMDRSRRQGRLTRAAEQSLFDPIPGVGEDVYRGGNDDGEWDGGTCDDIDLLHDLCRL